MDTYHFDQRAGVWKRHDGEKYRAAIRSADLEALSSPTPVELHEEASAERRGRALNAAVEDCLLDGADLLTRDTYSAILGQKRPMRHVLHILACVVTLGAWLTPYLLIAVLRKDVRFRLEVDRWGHVWPVVAT